MKITVYAGSATGKSKAFHRAAVEFGKAAATSGHELVYGGGAVGLMGAVADAALGAGGRVTGVMPRNLVSAEVAHTGLTTLHVVSTMHERKQLMADLCDAFVALPGGVGTAEEILEVWAWLILGDHGKPVTLLNVENYWGPLLSMADQMGTEGFLRPEEQGSLRQVLDFSDFMRTVNSWEAPPPRWLPANT